MCVSKKLRSKAGGIGKLASTMVVEMKRVVRADDEEHGQEGDSCEKGNIH